MRQLWCMVGMLAALQFHMGVAFAEVPAREPLVYYQILYLSFLTRSVCGDDIRDWPDNLHAIREILRRELGYGDQDLSAVEAKANDLRLTIPCNSEASRDLLAVTVGEPHVALAWFRSLKRVRNP